jgi:hypothetical protein
VHALLLWPNPKHTLTLFFLPLLQSSLSNLAVALSSGNEKLLTAERNQAVERMMIVAQKLSLG